MALILFTADHLKADHYPGGAATHNLYPDSTLKRHSRADQFSVQTSFIPFARAVPENVDHLAGDRDQDRVLPIPGG